MNKIILNIVTCGECGDVFAHKEGVETLTCPYCEYNDDICQFPDLLYPPDHKDSLITIKV